MINELYERRDKASRNLDSAVEHGNREMEMYWLGRKKAMTNLIEWYEEN